MRVFISPSVQTRNLYAIEGKPSEHEICQKIGLACGAYLVNMGAEAFCYTGLSMTEAVKMSNAYNANYHVCIHTNADRSGKAHGAVTFCHHSRVNNNTVERVHRNLIALIDNHNNDYKDDRGIKANDALYEIRKTKAICIYTETDFHSNPDCAEWIVENTAEIGRAIAFGIMNKEYNPFGNPLKYPEEVAKCKCGCRLEDCR